MTSNRLNCWRGRLEADAHGALAVLKRYGEQTQDLNATFAPPGVDGNSLQQAV